MASPTILALDFDGVLCDGLIEYFQTAWRAYCQLFDRADGTPPAGLAERFYPLRPVIETGWEMPLLLHALLEGVTDVAVLADWPAIAQQILAGTGLTADRTMAVVDGVRDRWIRTDLTGWLSQHRFYPGVLEQVQGAIAAGVYPVIISTKEGRFIQQLLAQHDLPLEAAQILGKEVRQPKTATLQQLLAQPPVGTPGQATIWFIEDRLLTLHRVAAQPDLDAVTLFLADWGYNTEAERAEAHRDSRIHLLSLSQLVQGFPAWVA
ncbi:MAG: HAD family hydrolase [Leptolyngbyaceae cyanobacterium T60_A2020_046]|nr:HAD family hydrolase [Leptolyngbyaceae cyanobacterium T60_A2020_046]